MVGDIDRDRQCRRLHTRSLSGLAQRRLVAIQGRHPRASPYEGPRHRLAQAARRPGDDDHPTLEIPDRPLHGFFHVNHPPSTTAPAGVRKRAESLDAPDSMRSMATGDASGGSIASTAAGAWIDSDSRATPASGSRAAGC